jgi:cyclic pyranopterin monophosphate synthase
MRNNKQNRGFLQYRGLTLPTHNLIISAMKELTHTDKKGKAVMVDVGDKEVQTRIARATGHIILAADTVRLIRANLLKKGDVLVVAQLAGINAAKQTSGLIPLCHNIVLDNVKIELSIDDTGVKAESEVKCTGKTGAEMEALTAVSVALLTIYDMCKAVDKKMVIDNTGLMEKIKL